MPTSSVKAVFITRPLSNAGRSGAPTRAGGVSIGPRRMPTVEQGIQSQLRNIETTAGQSMSW
jgi:hypothetical protein